MSVTLVNNSPQLTVATAGTRGLTGAHVVNASFSGSNLIITLSDGTVINAGGTILSSSGSNNWVGQQAINGNVIVTGSFILSGSNTLVNIGPASFSGSVDISGSTTITGSLIVSGGTINVIGTNLISASQGVTLANTTGYSTFSSSISQSLSHSVANLSSSIGSLSASVTTTIDTKFGSIVVTPFLSKSNYESYTASIVEPRLASLEGASGSIRLAHNEHTGAVNTATASLNSYTASNDTTNTTQNNRLNALETKTGSLNTQVSDLEVSWSAQYNDVVSLQITASSLVTSASINKGLIDPVVAITSSLYSTTASLNTFTASADSRLDAIESESGSWGASTDITALNTFSASVNTFSSSINDSTASLNTFTASANTSITALNIRSGSLLISASSLETSASAVQTRINALEVTSGSFNTFSSSVNLTTESLNTLTASLVISGSSLSTSASAAKNKIDVLEVSSGSHNTFSASVNSYTASNNIHTSSVNTTTASLNTYTASLKTAIDVTGGNTTILGNLTVQGTQIALDIANLRVADKLIEIASGSVNSAAADGAGIYISGADASITWNNGISKIDINKGVNVTGDIAVSGLVDGVELTQLSSSFNTISSSYLIQSASISASISTLTIASSSLSTSASESNNRLGNLEITSASFNTFTASTYSPFSQSVDDRILSLSSSLGGGSTGTRISALETSASLSAVTNSAQAGAILGLSALFVNLSGSAVGTVNQLNALNATASAAVITASVVSASIFALENQDNAFRNFTGSIETWIGPTGTFATASASFDLRIVSISAEIGGGASGIGSRVNSLEQYTSSNAAVSGSLISQSVRIVALESSGTYFDTKINQFSASISGSDTFINTLFPGISASFETRISASEAAIAGLDSGYATDSELVALSSSVAGTTTILFTSQSQLSASVWDPSSGLSSSIAITTTYVSSSITDRINGLVIGTGFVERSVFNGVTSSLNTSTASLNAFSASVRASGSIINTFTSSVNTSTSSLNAYTSSLKTALQPNGNDVNVSGNLFVSGNVIAEQYIVSTSVYYVTESNFEGDHIFGNTYGDSQVLNGITTINGALILNVSSSNPVSNPSFVSISADIRVVSGTVIAPIFVGTFDGAFSGSSQTNISGTTGFSNFTSSISESINTATSSLSSSVSSSIGLLSASVASINASQVSTASLEIITSSIYNTTQSLNNSTQSLNTFSASVIATGSLMNTFTSSVNSFSASVIATGSVINTFTASVIATGSVINTFTQSVNTSTSSLNTYTASLLGAVSVTGSNLRVLGNANIQNDLIVSGNIIAQQYIVSSSVTYMTTSFSNGSTIFGNDTNDTHQFTGSVYITNDITASNIRGTIIANNGLVSSSNQFVNYGALLTSSVSGIQAVSGTLIVSGNTSLTGSVGVDLRSGSEFYVRNGVTRIDSVLFVTDNDYVNSSYVGGDVKVNDYLAGGYTAHYDGGVQITGSLRVNAGQNGSGSYFTGSVWITGNEAVSGNLQVVGNTSISGNFIGTTISASSAVTASSLRVEGLTRINGEVDLDTTAITIGAGGNAVADETRLNTLNLRVDSDTFFNSNITAISGSTRFKSVAINDLSESRIPYVDSTDTLTDNANFTYNGVVFKIGGGRFEVDDSTGNIRTSGSLSVGALNISNNLDVAGAVGIQSTLTVTGSTLISSSLRATSTASFGALTVTGSSVLGGRLQVGTNAAVSGTFGVVGAVSLSSSLFVSGNITASANVNISGDVAITGSLNAVGPTIAFGNSMADNIYLSGNLEITGSLTRNTTNLRATGSNNPADAIYRLTEAQAWSASFVSASTIRTPDEYLEYFVGQGVNKKRYIVPLWIDETLYADDYFDISVVSGADSDYVF
jgi:hypothetical protein